MDGQGNERTGGVALRRELGLGSGSRRSAGVRWRLGASLALGLAVLAGATTLVLARDDAGIYDVLRFDARQSVRQAAPARSAAPPAERRAVAREAGPAPAKEASRTPRTRPETKAGAAPVRSAAFTPVPRRGSSAGAGGETVCVRLCDGYFFPLGTLRSEGDLGVHRAACSAACPGAATELFTRAQGADGIAEARSLDGGRAYTALPTAFLHSKRPVQGCSCTGPTRVADRLLPSQDMTMRRGDVVVGDASAKAFDGPSRAGTAFRDFRRARSLTASDRRRIDALLGVSDREARREAFLRDKTIIREVRVAEASAEPRPSRGFAVVEATGGFDAPRPVGGFRSVN